MEIQRGEGPTAPPLSNELVYIGDVLTLIFTLTDNVYWFDSNMLACFAVDGELLFIVHSGCILSYHWYNSGIFLF